MGVIYRIMTRRYGWMPFLWGTTRVFLSFVCGVCVSGLHGSGLVVFGVFLFPFVWKEGTHAPWSESLGPGRWMRFRGRRTDGRHNRTLLPRLLHTNLKKDAHRSIHPDARDRHLQRVRTNEVNEQSRRARFDRDTVFFVCVWYRSCMILIHPSTGDDEV